MSSQKHPIIFKSFRRLEQVLNSKTELFTKKIESLIEVWKQVCFCSLSEQQQYVAHLMDWAKLHTLNIVLTGEWKKYKDNYEQNLLFEVKNCEVVLLKLNSIFSFRCRKLGEVIKDPWGNPVLNRLLNTPDVTIGPEEIEFFSMETGYLVSMRLKKLCESHCEDLALNLVTAFMSCYQMSEIQMINLNATEDQKRFILDIYIALLYKYKKTALILSTLKSLNIQEGCELVKRFTNKRVNISKVWRHCTRIANLAGQVYITAAIVKPSEESDLILNDLLDVWLSLSTNEDCDSLTTVIRRIIQAAESAIHIYVVCEAIHKKFAARMKTFSIELYIRALTTDMNTLERQKNDAEPLKVTETSKRLAQGFIKLADILEDHVLASRECVLTAFSLEPTEYCLKRIEQCAKRCGFEILDTGQEWKCKLHPPVLPTDEVCWMCNVCGDYVSKPQLETSVTTTNLALNEALIAEQLHISSQLCDDLAVVLSSPRYQVFNWLLRWQDLHRLCVMYLHDPERTKNLVTELKFLDIDYSLFMTVKREVEDEDEMTGIERGYERYLDEDLYSDDLSSYSEDSGSRESRPYSLGSDGTCESPHSFLSAPPNSKSDPNVLKSLRMFRPSLKRTQLTHTEGLPKKIFIGSSECNSSIPVATHSQNFDFVHPEPSTSRQVTDGTVNVNDNPPKSLSPCLQNTILPVPNLNQCDNSKQNTVAQSIRLQDGKRLKESDVIKNSEILNENALNNVTEQCRTLHQSFLNSHSKTYPRTHSLNSEVISPTSPNITYNTIPNISSSNNSNSRSPENYTNYKIKLPSERLMPPPNEFGFPLNTEPQDNCAFKEIPIKTPVEEAPYKIKLGKMLPPNLIPKYFPEKVSKKVKPEFDLWPEVDDDKFPSKISCSINPFLHWSDFPQFNAIREQILKQAKELDEIQPETTSEILSEMNDEVQLKVKSKIQTKTNVEVLPEVNEVESKIETKAKGEILPKVNDEVQLKNTTQPKITVEIFPEMSEEARSRVKEAVRLKLRNHVQMKMRDELALKSSYQSPINNQRQTSFNQDEINHNNHSTVDIQQVSESKSPNCIEKISYTLPKGVYLKEARLVLHKLPEIITRNQAKLRRKSINNKKTKKSENKAKHPSPPKGHLEPKVWPLQDMNVRVVLNRNDVIQYKSPEKTGKFEKSKSPSDNKTPNPHVLLKRLDLENPSNVSSVLANVPGLNDLEMIRPSSVDHIVQVVQLSGGRPTSSIPAQSTQTSTQVSPHIQRIGQPRTEKPDPVNDSPSTPVTSSVLTTVSTTSKPTTTQSSTLINILSQQIIRPSQGNCIRPRTSPLVNILSQQILRPPVSISLPIKTISNNTTTEVQAQNTTRITTGGEHITGQLISVGPTTTAGPSLKTVVSAPVANQNRIVQLLCKSSDGKLVPVTHFGANRVVKVATPQTVSSTCPDLTENCTKLAQNAAKIKTEETEVSETLPKFQQAFGKSVYQNNVDSVESGVANNDTVNNTAGDKTDTVTKIPTKTTASINVQPIQGSVIYTHQAPRGQTINLIPPGRGQIFRIAASSSDQISLVKDTVIQNKMSALLAAALQGKQHNSNAREADTNSQDSTQTVGSLQLTRSTLMQNARIVKPVLQIPSNVIRNSPQPNLSSTTLEQLREFDMVYKQVKERSSTSTAPETGGQAEPAEVAQPVSYVNQGQKVNCAPVVVVSSYCNMQPTLTSVLSVTTQGTTSSSPSVSSASTPALPKTPTKSPKSKSTKSTTSHNSKASPIPKPQQKPQEDEHTTQRIFDILAEYAEQLRNSPDLNNKPAPRRRSNPPTNPSQNSKRKKSSGSKKTGQCSSTVTSDADVDDARTVGSEDSSCGVVQISLQEEEQPATVCSTSETIETTSKQVIFNDSSSNQARNVIIADSNVGEAFRMSSAAVLVPGNYIMPVSMVKGGQQIAVVSGGSKILATVPARSGPNMLLFQSFQRKPGLPTVKYSTIQQVSGISSQALAGVSAQPPVILPSTSQGLTTVTLSHPVTFKKLNDDERVDMGDVSTELLLAISQSQETGLPQPDSTMTVSDSKMDNSDAEESSSHCDNSTDKTFLYHKPLMGTPIATPVIAQTNCAKEELDGQSSSTRTIMALNLNPVDCDKGESSKVDEHREHVLVVTGPSNGPMLSHSPPNYNKQSESPEIISEPNKDDYLPNGGKKNLETKHIPGNIIYTLPGKNKKIPVGMQRLDRELHQLCLQRKQAALERELRLQKSLSEECEDLGVDEPSTSELFPEADLLFDTNHSPSFDQSSQDLIKRSHEEKEGPRMNLFSDDDNSGSLRNDFLFGSVEYQTTEVELECDGDRQLTNGQSSSSNESGSPCEDSTLLQNCASMSDVTIPSPISPDTYIDNTLSSLNKCKYKYSNRKKGLKQTDSWPVEVTSSEDTTGSMELLKSHSPELCLNKRGHSLSCDEDLSDGNFKAIRSSVSKNDYAKEEEVCAELHCDEDGECSPSGRGARRSVKKLCSCCSGSQDFASIVRKRPASRPHTPAPHKKAFVNKKR